MTSPHVIDHLQLQRRKRKEAELSFCCEPFLIRVEEKKEREKKMKEERRKGVRVFGEKARVGERDARGR
ncbi:hypothetical protein AXF42_Ash019515 [Apostasia shenzhenica]|uniref:Uncharacterized protein n=1 Tax=Apostasia shenzhenica TaxID=1088818 RepID=A0A2I0A0B9_9ASPA|nr:hypothetical protein AXF42_Ash019515 [Apostasia shenzhenica]